MARPFLIPDPNDRSVNEPSVIVSGNQVLGYYNQHNKQNKKTRVVSSVQQWYMNEAAKAGWTHQVFSGSQCILTKFITSSVVQPEEDVDVQPEEDVDAGF